MAPEKDLTQIVGPDRVIKDKDALDSFAADSSFTTGHAPELIVKPRNLEDVQAIVKLANDQGFALVPCSSSGPRSNGDTVPAVAGAVIVDLSDMKEIVRIDKRNKVAMIEPGVTFGELKTEVEKQGLRLEMPMLPRKDKSILASLLEREPTTGPKYNWDANDPLCCIELIFGTGDMFRTGNAAGPGTLQEQWASGQAQKIPMGPAQTDLGRLVQGAQGTFGIATWGTIKLELKPEIVRGYFVAGKSLDELVDFTYRILWRKIPDVCLILNNPDLAAITGLDSTSLPNWALLYSISGLHHLPEERLAYMEKDLAEISKEYSVKPVRNLSGISADNMVETVNGPGDEPYWKLRNKGQCLDLFFLTTLDRTQEFIAAVKGLASENDISEADLGIYIQPIRHGTGCHLEFHFMYAPEDAEKIKSLFDAAAAKCLELGGFFSRRYGACADMVYDKCPDTKQALNKLKNIFDPRGVLNPAKLCFGKEA